jgi:4-amino-4-deoxy-L-arabinose transferase-like glycosyltransferase
LLAEQLADGDGYRFPDGPTAYFPPGYPFVLAAGFLLTPTAWHTAVVVAVNIVAQLVTVVAVYAITLRLTGGRRSPAVTAAACLALWPNLVVHTAVALSESLFIALISLAVLVVLPPAGADSPMGARRPVVAGLLVGAATLVRPVALPVFVALGAAWLVAGLGWRRTLKRTALVAVASVAVVVPWVVRNSVVMDSPVLFTNTGDNLCMSRRVGGTGAFEFPNPRCNEGAFDGLRRPAYEVERDAHGRRLATQFIRSHPGEELRLVLRRAVRTFQSDDDGVAAAESYGEDPFLRSSFRLWLQRLSNAWYAVAAVSGAIGLGILVRRGRPDGLLVTFVALSLAIAPLVSFGDPRFKVPTIPFLAVGVGVLVDAYGNRLRT